MIAKNRSFQKLPAVVVIGGKNQHELLVDVRHDLRKPLLTIPKSKNSDTFTKTTSLEKLLKLNSPIMTTANWTTT